MNVEPSWPLIFNVTPGTEVTHEQLSQCAKLFSENYAVWGPRAKDVNKYLKAGSRVKMSVQKLESELLESKPQTALATCTTADGLHIGHAFATTWDFGSEKICWITQLVVSKPERQRGIATFLLRCLKRPEHTTFGIASSHPASCMATCRLANTDAAHIDLGFIQNNAHEVMSSCPVSYLKTASLHGSLFEKNNTGPVSTIFTSFYLERTESIAALAQWKARYKCHSVSWPLGELPEGHEYLVLVNARRPNV